MKRVLGLLMIAGLALMLFASCATPIYAAGQQEVAVSDAPVVKKGEISELPSVVSLRALVEITAAGGVFLVEDWDSKSKKSYQVVGDMANFLLNFRGEVVDTDVIFLERTTWSGSVVIVNLRLPGSNTSTIK